MPANGGVRVFNLAVFQNELYATGNFITTPSNSVCIQRWNDTTWSDAGPGGVNGAVSALTTYANGLYVGGSYFTLAGGVPVTHLARWDGTTYSPVGSGFGFGPDFGQMSCLATYQGKLFASGEFLSVDGVPCRSIGQFDGVSWDSVGTGADSVGIVVDSISMGPFGGWYYIHAPATISAMIEFGGELYVGGTFNMVGGVQARNVAKWAGTVAVKEGDSAPEAVVFPNPVDAWLSVEQLPLAGPLVLEVLDAAGKLVLSRSAYLGEAIPTTQLADGMYLLRLRGAEQPIHRTFLVRH
jgi:trimeric autotransporter adhesin